jgi:hypothetical protein
MAINKVNTESNYAIKPGAYNKLFSLKKLEFIN